MSNIIAIIGGSFIGQQWALLFTAYKYDVVIYEVNEDQLNYCKTGIKEQLLQFAREKISRSDENYESQYERIIITNKYEDLPKNSQYVMECVTENLEVKQAVFKEIDRYFSNDTVRMSSSSYLPVSKFTNNLINKSKCINAHPVNPPYFLRLVEIIPASYTDNITVLKTKELMENIEQKPVIYKKEIYGFGINRIQAAVYNSVFKLIKDDILEVKDIDKLICEGLGPRWAFYGPLTVAALNGPGINNYFTKYLANLDITNSEQNFEPQHNEIVTKRIMNELNLNSDNEALKILNASRCSNIGKILKMKLNKFD